MVWDKLNIKVRNKSVGNYTLSYFGGHVMKKQKISVMFLKKYQKESILAPLFKLLEAIMDLTVPLVIAQIIKNGIGQNDMSYVLKMFGL